MMDSESTPNKRPKLATPVDRKFSKIPIFIVDYHNEVLEFIYRCLATRHLPFKGNTLIHFDSHPDMVISRQISPATIFDKDELLSQLSIENWIMPTCYAGHFSKILWAKNIWCDQIPNGLHSFKIGDHENRIYVNLPVPYFISEGNYCDEKCLKNTKDITLQVIDPSTVDDGAGENDFLKIEDSIVLDIDLDYFSTTNPFLETYDKADTYRKLQKIFSYEDDEDDGNGKNQTTAADNNDDGKNYATASTSKMKCNINSAKVHSPEMLSDMRKEQLKHLESVFTYLQTNRNLDEFNNEFISEDIYSKIQELVTDIKENYDDSEIDWILIFDAGCTSDHNGLPHHISTAEQLNEYYKNFENILLKLPSPPILITIARSTEDNYCPNHQVDEIQDNVLQIISKVFGDKVTDDPILAFIDEDWDVMKL